MRGIVFLAVACSAAVLLGASTGAAAKQERCKLDNGIEHVVYIQFDNVHFRRDNPNVPSDLEQMPNLLNFLEDNGTFFTNHHTSLISHTSVDIVTSLTGVYGDKFGVPIGNNIGVFGPNGVATFPSSFTYWTDVLTADGTPEMLAQNGKNAPAPWVPFTRAGCDVGAFSIANIEFENVSSDNNNVFGPNSPQAIEAASNHNKAVADFEGIIIHCAQGSPLCAQNSAPDLLKDEPGSYNGFTALYGNANVQPQISPKGLVKDLDGNVIADSSNPPNPGFPGFDPTPSQTLGYLATMLEAGVPVVYGYIEGMVGPGIAQLGEFGAIFSDHTDIRPTLIHLVGLTDDYAHDGRVLFEALTHDAVGRGLRAHQDTLSALAEAYKAINAPLGKLGLGTLTGISTTALASDDATYTILVAQIQAITIKRNDIAGQMIDMLEDAAFNNQPIDEAKAVQLIREANDLLASISIP